jgi:hypothetical protein
MDSDADGSVQRKELEAWIKPRMEALKLTPPTGPSGFAGEIFRLADDNKDGQLVMEEVVSHKDALEHGHYGMVLHHELEVDDGNDEL